MWSPSRRHRSRCYSNWISGSYFWIILSVGRSFFFGKRDWIQMKSWISEWHVELMWRFEHLDAFVSNRQLVVGCEMMIFPGCIPSSRAPSVKGTCSATMLLYGRGAPWPICQNEAPWVVTTVAHCFDARNIQFLGILMDGDTSEGICILFTHNLGFRPRQNLWYGTVRHWRKRKIRLHPSLFKKLNRETGTAVNAEGSHNPLPRPRPEMQSHVKEVYGAGKTQIAPPNLPYLISFQTRDTTW